MRLWKDNLIEGNNNPSNKLRKGGKKGMKLDLKRFNELNGNEKYLQLLRTVKTIKQLEEYKKELIENLLPIIESAPDRKIVTPMGTLQYIESSIRETLDKEKVQELLGIVKYKECLKTSNVGATIRTSLKVD